MDDTKTDGGADLGAAAPPAFRVRLPGFLVEREIGLGDVVQRVTATAGIAPCGGCAGRAATLNRWVGFAPARRG